MNADCMDHLANGGGFGLAQIKQEGHVDDGDGISTPSYATESWRQSREVLKTLPWYLRYLGSPAIKHVLERMWCRALLHAERERRGLAND